MKNELLSKFESVEKELESLNEYELKKEIRSKPVQKLLLNEEVKLSSEVVEEMVMWRKAPTEFNNRKMAFLSTRETKSSFEKSINNLLGHCEFKFEYEVEIIPYKFIPALEQVVAKISSVSELLTKIPNRKFRIVVESSKDSELKIAILFEVDPELYDLRKEALKSLYGLKIRSQNSKLNITLLHNKEFIELSNVIGLKFNFDLTENKTELVNDTKKDDKLKNRGKLNGRRPEV